MIKNNSISSERNCLRSFYNAAKKRWISELRFYQTFSELDQLPDKFKGYII